MARRLRCWCVAAVALSLTSPASAAKDRLLLRLSDQLVSASAAWAEEGFQLQLRFGIENMLAGDTTVTGPTQTWDEYGNLQTGGLASLDAGVGGFSMAVEPGWRFANGLRLSSTFRYAALISGGGGFRWTTTADIAWHPWWGLLLAAGFGYGGMYYSNNDYNSNLQRSCSPGHGVLGVARFGYLFAAGELFSSGPIFEVGLQGTHCPLPQEYDYGGGMMQGTGGPVPPPQTTSTTQEYEWWVQPTWTLAWSFAWR